MKPVKPMKKNLKLIKNKTLSVYEDSDQETTFFFDGNEIISSMDFSDGAYPSEQMDSILEHFNIKVKPISLPSKDQKKAIQNHCEDDVVCFWLN